MTDSLNEQSYEPIGKCQSVASVLWPSFIVAGIANSIFWIFVDPIDFGMITGFPEISSIAAYSIGFIVFWFLLATSSFLTQVFAKPCKQVNKKSS